MDQTTTSHFPKKSLPLILSISAFSILFSFSFLPINDFSQMRSYITDKNYIFLFCNGILVIIIKSSGLASSSSFNSETKHEFVDKRADQVQPVAELAENKAKNTKVVIVESEKEQVCDNLSNEEEQVRVYESLGEEEEDQGDEYESVDDDYFFEVEDEGFALLSTEELNKKCDDFIRKMREGIKIQA